MHAKPVFGKAEKIKKERTTADSLQSLLNQGVKGVERREVHRVKGVVLRVSVNAHIM
jgi:hypothetical protein